MKEKVLTAIGVSGMILIWLDICTMITRVNVPNSISWIARIYYIISIAIYLYDLIAANTRDCREAARIQCMIRKRQSEERFMADYEAFRKEIHR